jgi:hypothetical protein
MATGLLLIDTDVLIDYSRGIEKTKGILKALESDHVLAISGSTGNFVGKCMRSYF